MANRAKTEKGGCMKNAIELALKRAAEHAELVSAAMLDLDPAGVEQAREHVGMLFAVLDRFKAGETIATDLDLVRDARAFFLNVMRTNPVIRSKQTLRYACEGIVVELDFVAGLWTGKTQWAEANKEVTRQHGTTAQ